MQLFDKKKKSVMKAGAVFIFVWLVIITGCSKYETVTREVTATAYNSLAEQTHAEHSAITAWGDTLEPGMKCIAVSRDLIQQGLTYRKEVSIEGLPGSYVVLDKMNARWENRIDIYMGENEELAKEWGIRTVTISWEIKKR